MKFLMLSLLFLQTSPTLQDNLGKLLHEFASTHYWTTTLHSCWNKAKLLELIRMRGHNFQGKFVSISKNISETNLSHNNLIVMDLNKCDSAWLDLLYINQSNLFVRRAKYFLIMENVSDTLRILQNFTVYPLSEVFIAEKDGNNYKIHQVYRINAVSDLRVENYGYWSPKSGLNRYLKYPSSRRRRNLGQQKIKIIFRVLNNDTWNHLDDLRDPSIDTFAKINYGSAKCLLDYCNVNTTYVGSDSFGYRDNNTGQFNGIVASLQHNEVDLTGVPLFLTLERHLAIDYLARQSPYSIKFLLKKPSLSFVKNIFILALEKNVWVSIAVILTVIAVSSFLILNPEAKIRNIGHQETFSISDVVLVSLEALCQQGTSPDPRRISGRILTLTISLAFMFIYVAYSANIVAMLQSQVEMKSTKELLDSRLAVGAEENNYIRSYISRDINRDLYQKKIDAGGYHSLEDGMEKLRKGYFALNIELCTAYHYIAKAFTNYEICSLQEMDGLLSDLIAYTAIPKNSPYKEIFKTGLIKIDEYGLRQRNYVRYYVKPMCSGQSANFDSIGLIDTQMPFMLIIYGSLLSFFVLLIEKITSDVRKGIN